MIFISKKPAAAPSGPTPSPVTFDGANDYLLRGGGLTGAVDGQYFAGYFKGGTSTAGLSIFEGTSGRVRVRYNSTRFNFSLLDTAGATIASVSTNTTGLDDGTVREFWFSYDPVVGTGLVSINGGANDAAGFSVTNTGTTDFTLSNWGVGSNTSGTVAWNGTMERLAVWFPSSLTGFDVTSGTDRTAMADHTNNTINSTQAIVDFFGAASDWNAGTNFGSGGNFTMNGAVT